MSRRAAVWIVLAVLVLSVGGWAAYRSFRHSPPAPIDEPKAEEPSLEQRFTTQVRPFLDSYCLGCHGPKRQEASLDLSQEQTTSNLTHWELVRQKLADGEMPPEDAPRHPSAEERDAVVAWIDDLRERDAQRNAGDPGRTLARRLSNAEYDYTIRDLTGVDLRPTRTFPVDPANEAGFDNSGESLTMSPALLKKYLAAARLVADHVILLPRGFVFASHPAVTDVDRDKYCVARVIDFYQRHDVDLAEYFFAAWRYRHRKDRDAKLSDFATEGAASAKYLAMVWSLLTEGEAAPGPVAAVRQLFAELPDQPEPARAGCVRLRDLVVRLRKPLQPKVDKLRVSGISSGSQPLVLWHNREMAKRHRIYSGDAIADVRKLAEQAKDDELAKAFDPAEVAPAKIRSSLERFCEVFPVAFVLVDREAYFAPKGAGKARPLTAGFHLMHGHFRDDGPLYDLILDEARRREIDGLWHELDFVTFSPMRQYKDFIFFERAEPPRFTVEEEFDFARSEDKDAVSEEKMTRLAKLYLAKAKKKQAGPEAVKAIEDYFAAMSAAVRRVERDRMAAEASHLDALVRFAERAYRRPLSAAERDDLLAFYRSLRERDKLGHEDAMRDAVVTVLVSPHFCYRVEPAEPGTKFRRVSGHELASRLSYFLWASMPDDELLASAEKLHEPEVRTAQVRRMLRDAKVRGLATEFGGNWLDFRRFEEHNAVDRERFPSFTNELRRSMFEEPIRYLIDLAQRDRSVLDLLYGDDTFVDGHLAKHYGMPAPKGAEWVHVEDARRHGRGGLLPMAVFLTRNAPGLRTSPVKRGYWVVRRMLGEHIPPPPPTVPELPKDEAKGDLTLPQLLARHRDDKSCAGCHRRFDSVGLVFEGYGPVGERRDKDLGGRPVETSGTFPDGKDRAGLDGLRAYLKEKRQDDFIDNLCRKLFAYAIGRSLTHADRPAIEEMRKRLVEGEYRFGALVEAIVATPQFLEKRGRDDARDQ